VSKPDGGPASHRGASLFKRVVVSLSYNPQASSIIRTSMGCYGLLPTA